MLYLLAEGYLKLQGGIIYTSRTGKPYKKAKFSADGVELDALVPPYTKTGEGSFVFSFLPDGKLWYVKSFEGRLEENLTVFGFTKVYNPHRNIFESEYSLKVVSPFDVQPNSVVLISGKLVSPSTIEAKMVERLGMFG